MKGLLLKDFYTIKSSIISLLITFMVIGFGISFFVVPQVLIIIATIVLGMSVTTIFRSVYKELHADHETGAADNK